MWRLFLTFFKIGAFTIGGGYVMLPIIEREVVQKWKWVGSEEFVDLIAIAQSTPGVIAINSATIIGYKVAGTGGALFAAIGAALPSFLIILLIANFFLQFREYSPVEAFMRGARAAVVGLLFYASFAMGKKVTESWKTVVLGITGFMAVFFLGIHPIAALIGAGIIGAIFFKE